MSYYVMITRRQNLDDEGSPIELSEWHDIVAADPELEPSAKFDGEATWHGTASNETCDMLWSEGEILVNYPGPDQLRKMVKIAQRLGARVLGESDEVYTADNIDQLLLEVFGDGTFEAKDALEPPRNSEREKSFSIERVFGLLFLLVLFALPSTMVKCSAEQKKRAEAERVEQEKLDRSFEEIRQAVRAGEAGPAFQRLFEADDPSRGKLD